MGTPAAEVHIDAELVRRLLRAQHPDLAARPLSVAAAGWDNVLVRIGDDLVARLPRREASAHLIAHEQRWLPDLAGRLPLVVPVPLREGSPGEGYPWRWSIARWLAGAPLHDAPPDDWTAAAEALGAFLAALHRPAPPGAPHNPLRGVPLVERADRFRDALARAPGWVDRTAAAQVWEAGLALPAPTSPAVWLHGDLHPLNLLTHDGRLSAVVDFGDLGAGDRAADLSCAWLVLPASARPALRAAAGARAPVDDATWARARAWALALGLAHLAGDGPVAEIGARAVREVLAEPA